MHFILLLFPLSPDKDFKHFCGYGLAQEFRHCFAELPSTSRFVDLILRLLLPFDLLLHCYRGRKTGIYSVPKALPAAFFGLVLSEKNRLSNIS